MNTAADHLNGADAEELGRFFGLALDLLCIADTEGTFRRLNAAWETTLGYPPEQLQGTRLVDLVHPDDVPLTKTAIGDLSAGSSVLTFVNRCRCREGTYRWIEWRALPYEGKLIYAAARDITERMRFEQAALEQKSTLETVMANMAQAMLIADAELRVVAVNPRFEPLFGFKEGEMRAGKSIETLIRLWASRTQTSEPQLDKVLRALRQRKPSVSEFWQMGADGSKMWIQIFHNPLPDGGFVRTYTDVTERKRAEEALKRRVGDIIDLLPDPTFAIDLEGRVMIWNRSAEEFTGVKAADMLGKSDHEYSIPFYGVRRPILIDLVREPCEEVERLYSSIKRVGEVLVGETYTRSVRRGEAYLMGTAAPLYDSEGKVTGVIESIRDITERKQAEEELKRHRDHLEELVAERTSQLVVAKKQAEAANEAKSGFLARMSHELRTPLNAILGYAQLLRRRRFEADVLGGLETIQRSGEHLLTLINDILSLSKIEAGKMELYPTPIQFPAFLDGIVGIIRSRAEAKGLTFAFEAPRSLPAGVEVDETRLRQVVLNLLDNAVKFTHQGRVTLRVEGLYANGPTGAPPPASPAWLRFEVQDTGVGIPADELGRIFLPFEQAGRVVRGIEGTGLGLAISRQLVRLMGSDLHVESELGRGSLFWFDLVLPVTHTAPETGPTSGRTVTGYRGTRRKILVVDDIASNRAVLVEMLRPLGFDVVEAADGQEAVHLAREAPPDLVLMDRYMPVMNGFEAALTIRQIPELRDVVIIAVSASVFQVDQSRSLEAGYDAFLPKPISWGRLLALLAEHLNLEWEHADAPRDEGHAAAGAVAPPIEDVLPPPKEEIAALLDLARMGDMTGIQERGTHIRALGEEYVPFADRLSELARRFDERGILALVTRLAEDGR